MMLFFCAIGASASITEAAACGPALFLFISLLLAVHLALVLTAGWLMGLPLDLVGQTLFPLTLPSFTFFIDQ